MHPAVAAPPDLLAAREASTWLARDLAIPCTVIGAGSTGDISQIVRVNVGTAWAVDQQTLLPGGFHPQPLAAPPRETMRLGPRRVEGAIGCA